MSDANNQGRKLSLEDLRDPEVAAKLSPQAPLPPPKPQLLDYGLTDEAISYLQSVRSGADATATKVRWVSFVCVTLAITIISGGLLFFVALIAGVIAAACASMICRTALGYPLEEYIFRSRLNTDWIEAEQRRLDYNLAKAKWATANSEFERILSRGAHIFWLSKTGTELENAVAEVFQDSGYDVEFTPHSYDQGIDLVLRKDQRTTVVQCKALGKPCGPNIVRDLFGAMHAFKADEAILVCPRGFTQGTAEFANGKPIKLYSVDELAKEMYQFESYMPHWIANAHSLEDIKREINKRFRPSRRRKYS